MAAGSTDWITVEVAYVLPTEQTILPLEIACGTTIGEVIEKSGILARFPRINLTTARVGVFGTLRGLTDTVDAGDRVEIYRELMVDPKQTRRERAAQARRAGKK